MAWKIDWTEIDVKRVYKIHQNSPNWELPSQLPMCPVVRFVDRKNTCKECFRKLTIYKQVPVTCICIIHGYNVVPPVSTELVGIGYIGETERPFKTVCIKLPVRTTAINVI